MSFSNLELTARTSTLKNKIDLAIAFSHKNEEEVDEKGKTWKSSTLSSRKFKNYSSRKSIEEQNFVNSSVRIQRDNSKLARISLSKGSVRNSTSEKFFQFQNEAVSGRAFVKKNEKISMADPEKLHERLKIFERQKEEMRLITEKNSTISSTMRKCQVSFEVLFTTLLDRASVCELETTLCDKGLEAIKRAVSLFSTFSFEVSTLKDKIRGLKGQISELSEALKDEQGKLVHLKPNFQRKSSKKAFESNINELSDVRNEREQELIKSSMAEFERFSRGEALEKRMIEAYNEHQEKLKALEEELNAKKSIISRFSVSMAAHKQSILKLEQELEAKNQRISLLQQEKEAMNAELGREKDSVSHIREIACMQKEEMDSYFSVNGFQKNQLGAMKVHYEELMEKYKGLLNERTLPETKDPEIQIKTSALHFIKKCLRLKKGREDEEDEGEYVLLRPDFQNYLEKTLHSRSWPVVPIMRITSIGQEPSAFDNKFLATIRGILDSKFNEFLLLGDFRSFSKFPDFVYSWLGRFTIDDSFRVRAAEAMEMGDLNVRRCEFYQFFSQKIIDKHWESLAFKEFMLENSPSDEVYFYLFCRNLIFQGPQMGNASNGFTFTHYVLLTRAFSVIDQILQNFSADIKDFLKGKFVERARTKTKLIDGGFVLSVLLDYYRVERKNRKMLIKRKIEVIGGLLDIEAVSLLLRELCPETSELDVIQVYNLAFNIGKGKIDFPSFYTALSEFNFFIKCLKISYEIDPSLKTEKEGEEKDSDVAMVLRDYKKNFSDITEVHTICSSFGVESIYEEISSYQRILNTSFRLPLHTLRGLNAVGSYLHYHSRLFQLRNHELYLRLLSQDIEEEEIMKSDEIIFNYLYSLLIMLKKKDHVRELEKNSMAKKIQKWVHNRFSKWFKLMLALFSKKNDAVSNFSNN